MLSIGFVHHAVQPCAASISLQHLLTLMTRFPAAGIAAMRSSCWLAPYTESGGGFPSAVLQRAGQAVTGVRSAASTWNRQPSQTCCPPCLCNIDPGFLADMQHRDPLRSVCVMVCMQLGLACSLGMAHAWCFHYSLNGLWVCGATTL